MLTSYLEVSGRNDEKQYRLGEMFSSLLSGFSNSAGRDKMHVGFMEAVGSPGDMRHKKGIRLNTSDHHTFTEKQITV